MSERRLVVRDESAEVSADQTLRHPHASATRLAERRARRPQTHAEVDAEYEAARNAWTAAMRMAQSGRPADLAALAMAQESYEAALSEKRRWDASPRAVAIEADRPRGIEAIVSNELARRRLHELEDQQRNEKPKGLRGILRRLRGG